MAPTGRHTNVGDLADRIRRMPPRLLLPHVRLDSDAPDRLELRDACSLPGHGSRLQLCLLEDPEEHVHAVVLVVDGERVRPARAGDGAASMLARAVATDVLPAPFAVRRRPRTADDPFPELSPAVREDEVVDSEAERETLAVGVNRLVVVEHLPTLLRSRPPDALEHCRQVGLVLGAQDLGDLVHDPGGEGDWLGPIARVVGRRPDGPLLSDELLGALLSSARGGDTERAVDLAGELGRALGDVHVALATPSPVLRQPVLPASSDVLAHWRRTAADAVAAAAVLAESGSVQRLRGGRERLREAFAQLDSAHGTSVLLGEALPGVDAFRVEVDGRVLLLPDQVGPSVDGHSPAQDVAVLLRGIARIAWTTHRRLVLADRAVASEQVADWENAMRELVLDGYLEVLDEAGHTELFDERLLTAFEIQAQCQALVRSVRTLSAGTVVSDTALAALLGR